MIPRRLHRIWFGDRPRPAVYDDWWNVWQALHPEWELFTWTEANIGPLVNQAAFDSVELTASSAGVAMAHNRAVAVQRADIAAYELVWRHGGVYVNCDLLPLRPLDDLRNARAFVGMEDAEFLCNAVMGAEPHHPFFEAAVARLPGRLRNHLGRGMEFETGPRHLTSVWRSDIEHWERKGLVVLPPSIFYPLHFHDIAAGSTPTDDQVAGARAAGAYTVHGWGHRTQEGDIPVSV